MICIKIRTMFKFTLGMNGEVLKRELNFELVAKPCARGFYFFYFLSLLIFLRLNCLRE